MDRITSSLLKEFAGEFGFANEEQDTLFELFASYVCVRRNFHEDFDPIDISTAGGGDAGIDAVAIVVNGTLVEDIDHLREVIQHTSHLDVTFTFVQATTSSKFEGAKIGIFTYGVEDFFGENPKLLESKGIKEAYEMMACLYDNSVKFRGSNPLCRLFYVSTGVWNEDAPIVARRDSAIQNLKDTNLFRDVQIELIGAKEVQAL
jgi:hypothetical protein